VTRLPFATQRALRPNGPTPRPALALPPNTTTTPNRKPARSAGSLSSC
jgi:hypothetical protein